jgi:hypothetical protein
MNNATLAWVLIGIGAIVVLIALFADPLGLGKSAGFGWKQGLGVIIGIVVILAGALSAATQERVRVGTGHPRGRLRAPGASHHPRPLSEGDEPPFCGR